MILNATTQPSPDIIPILPVFAKAPEEVCARIMLPDSRPAPRDA